MKFITLFIFLILFLSNRCLGQWTIIYQDTNYAHMEMHFLNADTGFVVGINMTNGTGGNIFRTYDGGNTWNILNSAFGNVSVHFPTETIGYSGGHDGWDPLESTCRHASLSIL